MPRRSDFSRCSSRKKLRILDCARECPDEVEPVLARLLVRRRHDLDDVAVSQLVAQRLELPVDARAGDVLAELRVDREGEVDGRRAAREHPHVALRSEHVDLVLEEVDLHALEELGRVLELLLPLDELPQPAEPLRRPARRCRPPDGPCTSSAPRCPRSATRCISCVRIWISMRSRPGPMTVVWSDWYMFGFGSAM